MEDEGNQWIPDLCGQRSQYDAFWSNSLTLNTSNPDLTLCFQRTVLLWAPSGWLWLLSIIYYVRRLYTIPRRHGTWDFSALNLIKVIISILISINAVLALVFTVAASDVPPVDYMYYTVRAMTMILAAVFVRWEFLKGIHSSGVTFLFWTYQCIADIIIFRSWIIRSSVMEVNMLQFVTYGIYFTLMCILYVLSFFSDRMALRWHYKQNSRRSPEKIPLVDKVDPNNEQPVNLESKKTLPEQSAPFWQKMTFMWITREIFKWYRKEIKFEMLYDIRPAEMCRRLLPAFYKMYNNNESADPLPQRKPDGSLRKHRSFFWSIFCTGGLILVPGVLLALLSLVFRVMQPLILGQIIDFIDNREPYVWKGVVLSIGLFLSGLLNTLIIHNYLYCAWLGGVRVRSIINATIYRKSLRLSGSAKKLTTTGEILNLMSVDAQKLQDAWIYSNLVWEVPAEIIICSSFIWTVLGPSTLSGLAVLCLIMPINGIMVTNWIRQLQAKQMKHKDSRIKSMSEILSGIKIIKLYAWEPPFLSRIMDTRSKELYFLKLANIITAFSNSVWYLTPYLVSLAVFATYVLISPSNILDANKVFVTLSLINIMSFTLSILPLGASFLGQAIVSVKRISDFLDMDELEEGVIEENNMMEDAISIENATFAWEKDGRTILESINLKVTPGQLIAVVGHVGSGKSSLISSLLGEMSKRSGRVRINSSMAYVPQQAWIQNAMLMDNILFGKKYDHDRYNNILAACALLPDLKILADGDRTEIGEKGINLSGGQKQRISLARAVYQDEAIYLLDDPLSAVDAHVGKHIFEKVISNKGLLRRKTRILVTHGIKFLPEVDVIIVMRNGTISEMGHYDELIKQNGPFAEFLCNYINEADDYSSDEEDEIKAIHEHLSALSESDKDMDLSPVRRKRRTRKVSKGATSDGEESMSRISESKPAKLIEEETAAVGKVRLRVIKRFVRAGGLAMFYTTILCEIMFAICQALTSFWLSSWSSDLPTVNGTMDKDLTDLRVGVYGGLGVGQALSLTIMLTACAIGGVEASKHLHADFVSKIVRAPMSFFDTTPLGRIMNRCSKDLDIIDSNIPIYIRGLLFAVSPVVPTAFIITYTTPVFIAAFIPLAIVYFLIQRIYIFYVRQIKRIDSIRRSPIYSHFDETINGTTSIRAYKRQEDFTAKCDRLIDESQRPFYLIIVSQRWLGVVMEVMAQIITFLAALFAVLSGSSVTGALAGMSISYALNVTALLNSLIRCMAELETYMVSVERVDEYCHVEQEADWTIPESETSKEWPDEGTIKIKHYGARYRPGLDLVLKDLSCDISSGEKIGIVGRTGAGKSSLALALFRIIEAAHGTITIDGVPIAHLGLHNLRSRLTIIPQDPVIFSGSLRENLDPFSEYNDTEIWRAIDLAHLKSFVEVLPEGLNHECGESGASLSVGQRQLVCLARAILRRTKVLVLDEATAAVDLETDALIQSTIMEVFKRCTILTIAHRLATVIDYDRIIVLDQGNVVEFDSPSRLLERPDSVFYGLAKEAGII